jgi:PAP2 superfamily
MPEVNCGSSATTRMHSPADHAPEVVAAAAGSEPSATEEPSGARARARAVIALFRRHPWSIEVAIFAGALVFYQLSRALVIGKPSTAFENAAGIIDWEKGSGLFVETTIQQWVLNHIQLTEALNYFYLYGHWTITPLFFVWLYKRRRRVYPYVRNAFLVANGIALGVFMVYPVAPPRLAATGEGLVDTLHLSGWFNPHAAVPSMHFGYAVMIGMVGLVLLRSWPLRLLAVAYPAVVFVTITGTANHYILDSVAGGLVVAVGFVGVWGWMSARGSLRPAPVRIRRTR